MERQGPRKGTVSKYLKVCNEIKYRCDNKIYFTFGNIVMEYKVSNALSSFLRRKGIVWETSNNLHEWNEKIPVTNKLILSFLNHVHEINKKSRINQEPIETNLFTEIKKDPVKRNTKQKPEPQGIGLIRRFIKWIY